MPACEHTPPYILMLFVVGRVKFSTPFCGISFIALEWAWQMPQAQVSNANNQVSLGTEIETESVGRTIAIVCGIEYESLKNTCHGKRLIGLESIKV